jgi:hypothetical protein
MRDNDNTKENEMTKNFTEAELFSMFNVDCAPTGPFSMNVPLLKVRVRKAKPNKRVKHTCDKIKTGITEEAPGKSRVDDLARFYDANASQEVSAFED